MKKLIFTFLVSILTCATISAEEVTNNNEANEATSTQLEAQPMENNILLQYPNLYVETNRFNSTDDNTTNYDDQGYRNTKKWKKGGVVRTVGMALVGVGAAALIAGISDVNSSSDDKPEKGLVKVMFTGPVCIGMGIIGVGTGAVLWAVGNHMRKKARLSYTGNGLAFNF